MIEPGRLRRALELPVHAVPEGWVAGDRLVHVQSGCSCPDAMHRAGQGCKHALAVHIWRKLGPEYLEALRALVHEPAPAPAES